MTHKQLLLWALDCIVLARLTNDRSFLAHARKFLNVARSMRQHNQG